VGSVLLVAGLLLVGCHRPDRPATRIPVVVDGPGVEGLSVTAGSGGQSVHRPAGVHGRWRATIGSFVLCLQGRQVPARILDVRPRPVPGLAPVAVAVWVRTVSPAAVAAAARPRRLDFEPVGSALGAPPRWVQPYRDAAYPGEYSTRVRGLVVSRPCTSTAAANAAIDRGRVPAVGFRELMLALTVDRRGGRVHGFDVTYEQGGVRRVVRADWTMTACGTAVHDRRLCPAHPPAR
jgi:hypothetical protein